MKVNSITFSMYSTRPENWSGTVNLVDEGGTSAYVPLSSADVLSVVVFLQEHHQSRIRGFGVEALVMKVEIPLLAAPTDILLTADDEIPF